MKAPVSRKEIIKCLKDYAFSNKSHIAFNLNGFAASSQIPLDRIVRIAYEYCNDDTDVLVENLNGKWILRKKECL
jgi:hypothetical protein